MFWLSYIVYPFRNQDSVGPSQNYCSPIIKVIQVKMRTEFNSIHLEDSVTVNQSLITGTHSEAAGILNFLTNSLGLSPPLFLNE